MIDNSPFPFISNGCRHPGLLFSWPERCAKCSHNACEKPKNSGLNLCSYGYNYQKITDTFIISGFLVQNSNLNSPARQKNLRNQKNKVVLNIQLSHAIERLHMISPSKAATFDKEKHDLIQQYIKEEQYKTDFLRDLKPEINKGLSFVHDYKQINSQIAQNINVIIESTHAGDSLEEKLKTASHPEKAIYWASKFLTEKLNVAKFLLHPDWITKESESDNFRFHGLFIKYLKIYQYMFDKKNIHVTVSGESHKNIYGNPEAIGVIAHTFLDNALKYSKSNGKVDVYISDEDKGIYFSVSSHGPRIKQSEREKIFQPFYRGDEANKLQEEGAGYGLYIAQLISSSIGAHIKVEQESLQKEKFGYLTTFSITIPY